MNTSYFGNLRNIKVPLSISQHPPKWYTGPQLKLLAPPWSLVQLAHKGLSEEQYRTEFYRLVLNNLSASEVYEAIIAEHGSDVTLLCFEKLEKPGDFCHRRMVAEWFETELAVNVLEWSPPESKSTLQF